MRHLVLWFPLVLGACASTQAPRAEPVAPAPAAKKRARRIVAKTPESRRRAAAIREVIVGNKGDIRACYAKAKEAGWAPDGKRKVAVKFTIQADGSVTKAVIAESNAQHAELEHCILSSVGTWMFPPPEGGGVVMVTYPFVFNT